MSLPSGCHAHLQDCHISLVEDRGFQTKLEHFLAHVLKPKHGTCLKTREEKLEKFVLQEMNTSVNPVGGKRKYHEKNRPMGSLFLNS